MRGLIFQTPDLELFVTHVLMDTMRREWDYGVSRGYWQGTKSSNVTKFLFSLCYELLLSLLRILLHLFEGVKTSSKEKAKKEGKQRKNTQERKPNKLPNCMVPVKKKRKYAMGMNNSLRKDSITHQGEALIDVTQQTYEPGNLLSEFTVTG